MDMRICYKHYIIGLDYSLLNFDEGEIWGIICVSEVWIVIVVV